MSLQNQMRELLSLDKRALLARENEDELEALLWEYRHLILARVLQFCQSSADDYLEAGFLAFAEAIRFYDGQKGSFISFAQGVIKRRLIDVSRKKPGARELLLGDDTEKQEALLRAAALQAHAQKQEQQARCEEIAALQKELAVFRLRFSDLEAAAPKQERTRAQCKKAITLVLSNQRLRAAVLDGRVPCKELAVAQGISPKVIERHRRYILAAVLIHCGDYPLIQSYIPLQTQDDNPVDHGTVDAGAHMKPVVKNRSDGAPGNAFQNECRLARNAVRTNFIFLFLSFRNFLKFSERRLANGHRDGNNDDIRTEPTTGWKPVVGSTGGWKPPKAPICRCYRFSCFRQCPDF